MEERKRDRAEGLSVYILYVHIYHINTIIITLEYSIYCSAIFKSDFLSVSDGGRPFVFANCCSQSCRFFLLCLCFVCALSSSFSSKIFAIPVGGGALLDGGVCVLLPFSPEAEAGGDSMN